jgi:hypothetical protein
MAANARSSGSRLVVAAVGGTLAAVGIGTIYLPFVADRDVMRGLHEEAAPPTSAMLAQEIRKLQREGLLRGDEEDDMPKQDGKKLSAGSMWKKFSK